MTHNKHRGQRKTKNYGKKIVFEKKKVKKKDLKPYQNKLPQHGDKNALRYRLHHCHLRQRPEALPKTEHYSMKTKTGSVTDFVTAIYNKGLNL